MPPEEQQVDPSTTSPDSGSDGGSPATDGSSPAEAPAPASPEPSDADPASSDASSYEALGLDSYEDITEGLTDGGAEPTIPPVQQPAAEPPPAAQQAAEEPPVEEQPPAAQPPVQPGAELPSFDDGIDGLIGVFSANYHDLVNAVAQARFQLTKEELEELETDVVTAVPKLLAKAQVNSLHAMLHYTKHLVPQMIQSTMARHQVAMGVEQAFFSEFPDLNRAQHGQAISQVAEMLYSRNPNMPIPDLLRHTGRMVKAAFGIQDAVAPPPPARQRTAAFQPAAASGRHVQATPLPDQPFAGLGMDFDEG